MLEAQKALGLGMGLASMTDYRLGRELWVALWDYLDEGIIDGTGVGYRAVGNRVGLGVGKTEGLPVGEGVGMAVGSHVVHVSDKDVARPPVVSPMSYVVKVAVAKGGVFI